MKKLAVRLNKLRDLVVHIHKHKHSNSEK